jgi:PPOX class probable F420-dependent enzyme
VSQREQVAMTAGDMAAMLAESAKLQLATINRDGTAHLVTMYYAMLDGRIAFWTYRSSQKARNIGRDPRVTCLVETGEDYFDLRGVQIAGTARCVAEPGEVLDIGRRIAARMGGVPADALEDYVTHAARKRLGYIVEPVRVISWDHRKLLPPAG